MIYYLRSRFLIAVICVYAHYISYDAEDFLLNDGGLAWFQHNVIGSVVLSKYDSDEITLIDR